MNVSGRTISLWVLRGAEWALALIGAVICVGVAAITVSNQPDQLWPAPGIYLLEIILVGLLAFASRVLDRDDVKFDYGLLTWIAGGILLAFVILAGFSIGPFLFPAMAAFWVAAFLGDRRQGRRILPHFGIALLAAVLQAGLIIVLALLTRP